MAVTFVGVCLVTQNVPRLAQFYVQVLGAQAEGDATHVEPRTAGAQLTIFSFEGMQQWRPDPCTAREPATSRWDLKSRMSMPNMIGCEPWQLRL